MNRAEWLAAWRYARRIMSRRGGRLCSEGDAAYMGNIELGRTLTMRAKEAATRTRYERKYARDELASLHNRCCEALGHHYGMWFPGHDRPIESKEHTR